MRNFWLDDGDRVDMIEQLQVLCSASLVDKTRPFSICSVTVRLMQGSPKIRTLLCYGLILDGLFLRAKPGQAREGRALMRCLCTIYLSFLGRPLFLLSVSFCLDSSESSFLS